MKRLNAEPIEPVRGQGITPSRGLTTEEHLDRIVKALHWCRACTGGHGSIEARDLCAPCLGWESLTALREKIAELQAAADEIGRVKADALNGYTVVCKKRNEELARIEALEKEREGFMAWRKAMWESARFQSMRIAALEEALREMIAKFSPVQCQEPICDGLIGAALEIARAALVPESASVPASSRTDPHLTPSPSGGEL